MGHAQEHGQEILSLLVLQQQNYNKVEVTTVTQPQSVRSQWMLMHGAHKSPAIARRAILVCLHCVKCNF